MTRTELVSLAIGAISFGYAIYTNVNSKEIRDPTFVSDPARVVVVSSHQVSGAPIRVLRADGTPLVSDLVSVRVFFWNRGGLPIRSEDVLTPIEVRLNGQRASILDARILKLSRSETKFRIAKSPGDPERALRLDFSILERNDGALCQILYEGEPGIPVTVSGTLVGVRQIRTPESDVDRGFFSNYLQNLAFVALVVCVMIPLLATTFLMVYAVDRWGSKRRPYPSFWIVMRNASRMVNRRVAIVLALLLVVVPLAFSQRAHRRVPLIETVPSSIREVRGTPAGGRAVIGVQLSNRKIVGLDAAGPAELAGVRVGDQLISVNGVQLNGNSQHDVDIIMGDPGSTASLLIQRGDSTTDIAVRRAGP